MAVMQILFRLLLHFHMKCQIVSACIGLSDPGLYCKTVCSDLFAPVLRNLKINSKMEISFGRDHSAGNYAMKQRYSGVRIYGGVGDNVPDITQ